MDRWATVLNYFAEPVVQRIGSGKEQSAVQAYHGEPGERLIVRILAGLPEDVCARLACE